MDATRLNRSLARLGEYAALAASRVERLSEPAARRRIWRGLCAVALLWILFGLAQLTWQLLPTPRSETQPRGVPDNPAGSAGQTPAPAVDIEDLASWPLFGRADAVMPPPAETAEAPALDGELAGVGDDAEETRLPLMLVGIAYSSDQSRARAIIEARQAQGQYASGDDLPVGNEVTLARILSDRVVLNNQGKYELLRLFEDGGPANSAPRAVDAQARAAADRRQARQQRNEAISRMAEAHRRGEYGTPESLSEVVNIEPFGEDGAIAGYRVSAGRDSAQFEALGFREDDVVIAVNGVSLTDPGREVELFRVMHSAQDASFEVLRDGEQITLNVGIGQALAQ